MKFKNKIKIRVNGKKVTYIENGSIESLIKKLKIPLNKVAIELNKNILNKKKINKIKFKNDFEILSVLRNLKVIGIFTRLALRDKKKKYLQLIPYTWKLIEDRINNNDLFIDLKKILEKEFPKKIRIKK